MCVNILKKIYIYLPTCIWPNWFEFWDAGGALVGIPMGAIKGQTTETGLVRGSCVGAITGAITALQIMDMMVNGEPFSKVFTNT